MGITANSLIDKNTLWPLAVLCSIRTQQCRDLTRSEMQYCGHPYLHFGLMASCSAWPKYLRYCTFCAESDRKQFLETFWHRAHQLPGIEAYHMHGILLQNSSARYRQNRNRHAHVSAEICVGREHPLPIGATAEELLLAKGAEWLLKNSRAYMARGELRCRYQARLVEMGYANHCGRLYLQSFRKTLPSRILQSGWRELGVDRRESFPLGS